MRGGRLSKSVGPPLCGQWSQQGSSSSKSASGPSKIPGAKVSTTCSTPWAVRGERTKTRLLAHSLSAWPDLHVHACSTCLFSMSACQESWRIPCLRPNHKEIEHIMSCPRGTWGSKNYSILRVFGDSGIQTVRLQQRIWDVQIATEWNTMLA